MHPVFKFDKQPASKRILLFLIVVLTPILLWAYSSGAPQRSTGAPGDNTCLRGGCHVGSRTENSASLDVLWEGGSSYQPGIKQRFTVRINDTARRYGMQATARLSSNSINGAAGTFTPLSSAMYVICDSGNDRQANGCPPATPVEFITHSDASTSNTFTFDWTPPANQSAGAVEIYVAANASNGPAPNGAKIHLMRLVLTPSGTSVPLQFTTAPSLPSGRVGSPYTTSIGAAGGSVSQGVSFLVVSGALPAGLQLSSLGVISGVPVQQGNFNFTVRLTDSSGASVSQQFSLLVSPAPLSLTAPALPIANLGQTYTFAFAASGGTAPYTFILSSGSLPAGLSFNSSGGLSGVPSQAGTFQFGIRVQDNTGQSLQTSASLIVRSPPPGLTVISLPEGTVNVPYQGLISGTSAAGLQVRLAVSGGSLPPGLALNSNGAINGTPLAAGVFSFAIQATDSLESTSTLTASIRVVAVSGPLRIASTSAPPQPQLLVPYTFRDLALGGNPPYSWSLASGTLPSGLRLDPLTGTWTGQPLSSGRFTFSTRVSDQTGSTAVSNPVTLDVGEPQQLPEGKAGQSYQVRLSQIGFSNVMSWTIDSNSGGYFPPGLNLDSASSLISGVPIASGSFTFVVRALGFDSTVRQIPFAMVISPALSLEPVPQFLPGASAGSAYRQSLAFSDGSRPSSLALVYGALPPGLSIESQSPVISGVPVSPGIFHFGLALGSGGVVSTRTFGFSLVVAPAGSPNLSAVVNAASYSQSSVAPGQLLAIFGVGLGPNELQRVGISENGFLATELSGVRVLFNGVAAPLLYVSNMQIGVVAPFGLASRSTSDIVVESNRLQSAPSRFVVIPAQPGLFSADGTGTNGVAALNQNGSFNSPVNPAERGEIITMYGTGGGQMSPPGLDGKVSDALSNLNGTLLVEIDGRPATVLYAGNSPGLIQGVIQFNVRIPTDVRGGALSVVVKVGLQESRLGTTVWVRP